MAQNQTDQPKLLKNYPFMNYVIYMYVYIMEKSKKIVIWLLYIYFSWQVAKIIFFLWILTLQKREQKKKTWAWSNVIV